MKCCVYSRFYYDTPYINAFIEHYLSLGFDKIFLLKSDPLGEAEYDLPTQFRDKVSIKRVKNLGNRILPKHSGIVKKDMDWVLSIDTDEFLFLNKKFNNIKDFLTSKTLKHPRVNNFLFRWLMIEKYDNFKIENFSQLIDRYSYRANGHIKSMSKVSDLHSLGCHYPSLTNMRNFHEGQVLRGMPQVRRTPPCKASYTESLLLHLHTRSIKSVVIKAFKTVLKNKSIHNRNVFKNLVKTQDDIDSGHLLKKFCDAIGDKARLPFHHMSKFPNYKIEDVFKNYSITPGTFSLIDYKEEDRLVKNICKNNNIDFDSFQKLEERLSGIIYSKKILHKK
tara:strand:- start:254 stop:1258 length:1005 start_codon:yes stop_codon:yes gene_type:complete